MSTVHIWSNMETERPRRESRVERRRLRLSTLARRTGLDPRREVLIAQRNGRWVLQRDWRNTFVGRDDVIAFVIMPTGDVGRTIAQVAVLIAAVVIAGPLGGAAALSGALGIGAGAATALIVGGTGLIGGYAINALLPLPAPNAPGLSSSLSDIDANSPTYAFTVTSQQNLPRLGGKIPEWFGYHRVIPDLAATAWWEWNGGRQTLYETLCLTKGYLDVEKIELGRTPIDSFEQIDHALFEPGDVADLFEPEVYQAPDVGGITLNAPNDLVLPDDGIYGPFAALPPGQQTRRIGVDIHFPRGLYLSEAGGSLSAKTVQWRLEAREIDDGGAPLGSWFTVANETFNSSPGAGNTSTPEAGITGEFRGGGFAATNKLNSPLTVSYRYELAGTARYECRMRRLDNKDLSALAGHDVSWVGLRGFLGGGTYGDVTVLQLAILATASVNDRTTRQIAVTGTRKLPVYDAETETWSAPVATRSIAWAVAHVLRGVNGGRLAESQFDLDHLLALHAVWEERGNYFDYYASAPRQLWDMLQTIMRCGRATPFRQGSQVRFYRDAPQTLSATGFSRENIVQHTLRINYRLPEPDDDADGIEVKFFDKRTWNFNTLRKKFAGEGTPSRPIARALDGCIEVAAAQEELDYYVAEYNLRPISAEFDTEREGMWPAYGDLVYLAHDSPRWGLSNRVIDWNAETRTVTLFSPPLWTFARPADGGAWYVRIRDKKGRLSAQVLIDDAPSSTSIVLHTVPVYENGSPFDFTLSDTELLHVLIGQASDAPRRALFRGMRPRQGSVCSVQVVLEDDGVHVN